MLGRPQLLLSRAIQNLHQHRPRTPIGTLRPWLGSLRSTALPRMSNICHQSCSLSTSIRHCLARHDLCQYYRPQHWPRVRHIHQQRLTWNTSIKVRRTTPLIRTTSMSTNTPQTTASRYRQHFPPCCPLRTQQSRSRHLARTT